MRMNIEHFKLVVVKLIKLGVFMLKNSVRNLLY